MPFKVNKWVLMAEAASTAFFIYEINEIFSNSKSIPTLSAGKSAIAKPTSKNPSKTKGNKLYDPMALQSINNNSISSGKSKMESQTKYTYSEDPTYVSKLWKSSMGWKFRDYVILAPKNDSAWSHKAAKLKAIASKKWSKAIYNYWNKEYLRESQINGEKIHALCTSILYENDYGIWFTRLSQWNNKSFFDFAWRACGRDDKNKPADWRFSEKW